MDDGTYRIAAGVLGVTLVALFLDALLPSFAPPSGVWTVLVAVATFLGARGALRKKNGEERE